MPELPEVETVTNALRPLLVGRKIIGIDIYTKKLRYPIEGNQTHKVLNKKIVSVKRRTKHKLIELENCNAIILHLGMSGSCRIERSTDRVRLHDHIVWHFDDGFSWRFNDPRRFGFVKNVNCDVTGFCLAFTTEFTEKNRQSYQTCS